MDDVKNQLIGFAKKLNNPFASSSSGFKGEGRKLGGNTSAQVRPQGEDLRRLHQQRLDQEKRPGSAPAGSQQYSSKPSTNKGWSHSVSPQTLNQDYEANIIEALKAQSVGQSESSSDLNSNRDETYHIQSKHDIEKDALECSRNASPASASVACEPDTSNATKDLIEIKPDTRNATEGLVESKPDTGNATEISVEFKPDTEGVRDATSLSFDPSSPYIASKSSTSSKGGDQMLQCPVCGGWWRTEKEVNAHVDECLNQNGSTTSANELDSNSKIGIERTKAAVGVFLSDGPSSNTVDVILRVLRNIVNNPELEKFRKIRMSNPKVHDTIGMALGGVELLESLGFEYQSEEEEIWGVMNLPSSEQIEIIKGIISELETCILGPSKEETEPKNSNVIQRKVDRKIRVFYAAPENLAAKMELPDSFFQVTPSEMRREAAARKKILEDSQLFVSRASREKLGAANKRRYKAAIIRIQFPDGVILQGMFLPWEPTSALYEFVASALRNPSLRFDLLAPLALKKQIIPSFTNGTNKIPTLEEANLVPASLVKFQCIEEDASMFTGLHPDFLLKLEPLTSTTFTVQ